MAEEKKKKGLIAEFREFISRGNVMDMAVGVIIATAFGKITTSLVDDVVMPLLNFAFGGIDTTGLNITIREAVVDEAGNVVSEAVSIGIGTFVGTIINFLLVALSVFLVIKAINTARERAENLLKIKKAEEPPAPPPEPSAEEKLLTEIRDLLQEQKK